MASRKTTICSFAVRLSGPNREKVMSALRGQQRQLFGSSATPHVRAFLTALRHGNEHAIGHKGLGVPFGLLLFTIGLHRGSLVFPTYVFALWTSSHVAQ